MFRKEVEREMKVVERRLNDEKDKLSTEIGRLKKQIEEKEAEKIRAVRDAKADGDQRVIFFTLFQTISLNHSFPTGVSEGVKEVSGVLPLLFYNMECHKLSFLIQQGCCQFLRPAGCREPKKDWKTLL
jgi:hypothetical protein